MHKYSVCKSYSARSEGVCVKSPSGSVEKIFPDRFLKDTQIQLTFQRH